jgi:hypothetical protein
MIRLDEAAIDTLVSESRALRESVHTLIARMRREHLGWRHDLLCMTRSLRLTVPQRRRLRKPLRQGVRR